MKQAKNIAAFGIFRVNLPEDPHLGRQSFTLLFLEPPANKPFVSTPKTYQFTAHARIHCFRLKCYNQRCLCMNLPPSLQTVLCCNF